MSWFKIVVFVVLSVGANAEDSFGRIFPKDPEGLLNQNYAVKITGLRAPLRKCNISGSPRNQEGERIPIILNSTNNKAPPEFDISYINGEKDGECGVLFSPFILNYVGDWDFNVTDADGKSGSKRANIGRIDETGPLQPKTVQVKLGDSTTVFCNTDSTIYSKAYNPKGELVKEGFDTRIEIVMARKEDAGKWQCGVLLENSYKENYYDVNIEVIEELITAKRTETDSQVNLLWKLTYEPKSCIFQRPDQQYFYIREGVIYEKYNYFGQGMDLNECGISIPKPLDAKDVGIWKFMTKPYRNGEPFSGGFLQVGQVSQSELINKSSIPVYTTTKNITLVEGSDLTIQCSARSSITYCYLESPSKKTYNSYSYGKSGTWLYTGVGLEIGDCQVTIPAEELNMTDTGNWICGMGVKDMMEDLQVRIKVVMSQNNMTTNSLHVKGSMDSSVTIMLTSAKGYAFSFCRFNRPDGVGINLVTNTSNSRYSYYGEGLEKGVCGLRINSLQNEDIGLWKASATFNALFKHVEEETYIIQVSAFDEFETMNITIGVISSVAVVAVVVIIYIIWRKRKNAAQQNLAARHRMNEENADRNRDLETLSDLYRRRLNGEPSGEGSLSRRNISPAETRNTLSRNIFGIDETGGNLWHEEDARL